MFYAIQTALRASPLSLREACRKVWNMGRETSEVCRLGTPDPAKRRGDTQKAIVAYDMSKLTDLMTLGILWQMM